jgi:MFS family permease
MAQLPHIDSSVRGDDHREAVGDGVLGAVAFMAQLDLCVVNVALPAMGDTYAGASLSALSWVLNAYTVVFAALLIPAGRLADHFGRRRFLVAGTIVFTVASGLCAAAPSLAILRLPRSVMLAARRTWDRSTVPSPGVM